MIASMTGFGKSSGVFEGKKCSIEIRSLNGKGLDLNLKLPSFYRALEVEFRKIIGEQLDRGKVDVSVYIESNQISPTVNINKELANQYHNLLIDLSKEWGEDRPNLMELILKMPDVVSNINEEASENEVLFILNLLKDACAQNMHFRTSEGAVLREDVLNSIHRIDDLLTSISPFEKERTDSVRDRLEKLVQGQGGDAIDSNRLEQEFLYYLDKLDVSEEKIRLKSHIDYFEQTLDVPKSGKKLGFIIQEMGREINTLGSKSNHSEMQKIVVEMKNYLEKIKEQTLNVL